MTKINREMKNINKILILVGIFALLASSSAMAEKSKGVVISAKQKANATCLPATNSNELTVNNVRAYLETNGTMWFKEVAEYEVPKESGMTSMFCAALWIGGRDINQQLKLAAVRFRQKGDDFWTGPLTVVGASVDQETCSEYDKHFKITREQVEAHIAAFDENGNLIDPEYVTPSIITNWPAHGDVSKGQSKYLAPFKDLGEDGEYNPDQGDYPYYDLDNELCPWTEENIAAAAAGTLPITPEEASGVTTGMIYADHVLKGDETLYWIFNDKGAAHTESEGDPIGLEIRGQAFGFSTNDDLNNMTFYSYEIINRSTYELTNTYFSQWVDPDLGYANDDYVGCDVARGLGYCYNGYDVDGTGQTWAYGSQPPAVGVDFFQGPYIDDDGRDNPKFYQDSAIVAGYCDRYLESDYAVDQMAINGVNFGDGIVDNERFGMRRFVYHNNDATSTGDPDVAIDYYRMLQGIWRDGIRMRYGANAHPSNGASGPECDFMFPGTTDPCNWGTAGVDPNISQYGDGGWTEANVGNAPYDRRFMQSAGPFTLKAGSVNYITVGIPWARASQGGAWASVELLKIADDKCQSLFENCFKVLSGPDAPDVTIRELENELILYITNDDPLSNNYNETYEEFDNQIAEFREIETSENVIDTIHAYTQDGRDSIITYTRTVTNVENVANDRYYHFEGYMIYQLKNQSVSVTDLDNPDKAQLVGQCDIENYRSDGSGVGQLVNWVYNDALSASVATEMVNGSNNGIYHSLKLTEDKFASTATELVNHKTYYYMVLAYGYNEFAPYSITNGVEGLAGQQTVFLAGRRNIQVYSGIPHKTTPQNEGTILNSEYGTQPMITRVEGQGNGGYFLDMTDESRDKIMSGGDIDGNGQPTWAINEIQYKNNYGPLGIKVIDPLKVKSFDYSIKFIENADDVTDSTTWELEILDVTDEELINMGLVDDDNNPMRTINSNMAINMTNEQLILPLGISVSIKNYGFQIHQSELLDWVNTTTTGLNYVNTSKYAQVDYIGSSIEYADESKPWLGGVEDNEGDFPDNWIRSGRQNSGQWQGLEDGEGVRDDYAQWKTEDFFILMAAGTLNDSWQSRGWKDPNGQFEDALDGTWAPYVLSSPYNGGPQAKYIFPDTIPGVQPQQPYYDFTLLGAIPNCPGFNQTMTNIYSVDIVLTSDKSKWTRCIVLEACDNANLSEGGALKHEPRKHASVDKDGNPDGTGYGMGWFPGYAINVETGERLNLMFSENSSDTKNNGNDMLFNPTDVYAYYHYVDEEAGIDTLWTISATAYNSLFDGTTEPVWGGKHFVYVCGSSGNTNSIFYSTRGFDRERNYNDGYQLFLSNGINQGGTFSYGGTDYPFYECGPYDEGAWLKAKFAQFVDNTTLAANVVHQYKMQLFSNVMWTSIPMPAYGQDENWLSNQAVVKLRVTRPYMRYSSRWYDSPSSAPNASQNNGFPMYTFTTKNIAPTTNAESTYQTILDEINVVPNPYYGFSMYESTALENYIKIVNLPENCSISIFTVGGILVKTISKGDSGSTYVNWDLKNNAGIPIASGVYIIHVKAPGIGERTLKFFCAMRPVDLNAF